MDLELAAHATDGEAHQGQSECWVACFLEFKNCLLPVSPPAFKCVFVNVWLSFFMCVLMCVYPVRGCACAYVLEQVIMQDGYPFKQMNKRIFKNLDEIYAGACDGMTYEFAILFLL